MLLKGYDSSNGTFAGCSIFSNKDFESQQLQADVEILVDDFNFVEDIDLYRYDGTSFSLVSGWEATKESRAAARQALIDALNAQEINMPVVKGKKYPYTASGKKAAAAARTPKKIKKK